MSTWYSVCCPGLPLEDSGLPLAVVLPPHYTVDQRVWGLEIILPCILLIEGGPGHPLTRVTGLGMVGDVNHRGHFGHGTDIGGHGSSAVAFQGCTGLLQGEISKACEGDESCECPSPFPKAGIWEWHHELLWDLLWGWDARLHPLHAELRPPTHCSASIHSWQSQEPSVCGWQWAVSLQPL